MNSHRQRVLLDKNIVRRAFETRVRLAAGEPPTLLQVEASNAFKRLRVLKLQIYVTQETEHVLRRRNPLFAREILRQTQTLSKGRYLRRWARRLRDFGISREDAVVIAYGSFGADVSSQKIGVDVIVSGDLTLVTNFSTRAVKIQEQFDRMTANLNPPYNSLLLPKIVTPATVLTNW